MKRFSRALLLLFCASALAGTARAQQSAARFDHVIFIGASVSAGFGAGLPPSTPFDKAILTEHRPVERFANPLFFMNATLEGTRQIDRVIAAKPSLAIGVDYLIWYLYGVGSAEARLKNLEAGLAQLERLAIPVAVGDIPDIFDADPAMISPQQIPSPATIEAANRRIREWAKTRQDVLILPLAAWVVDMRTGKLSLALSQGRTLTPSPEKVRLPDRVHTSKLGTVMLTGLLVDSLREWTGVSRKDFNFDAEQALRDAGEVF